MRPLPPRASYDAPGRFRPERIRAVEHLDRPGVDAGEKARSHGDLERIARLPFGHGPLARAVVGIARTGGRGPEPLRLLELGAGTGSVGLRIARRAARAGWRVHLTLTDIDTSHLPAPGRLGGVEVDCRRLDVLEDDLPTADVVFANLLIHHLDDAGAGELLARMRRAGRLGGAVYDLVRGRWAFELLRAFFPLWARSPITVADSLISVQQAFRPEELLRLARGAGIERPRLRTIMGVRSLLHWRSASPWSP
jgi:SAM-dependent methyltransferase